MDSGRKTSMRIWKGRRSLARLVVACVAVAVAAGVVGSMATAVPGQGGQPAYADGVVLVGFAPGTSASAKASARKAAGAVASERISPLATDAEKLTLGNGATVDQAIQALQRNPNVRYAEPDYQLQPAETSNDTYFTSGSLWGMYGNLSSPANQYGSQAAEAWATGLTGSRNVYVGVIDEGIQFDHPDLAANVWLNPYDPVDGVDNDGNGYIDDTRGWDFYNRDNTVYDSTGDDHATHVAGTIGGIGGNGAGVAGVNWQVTMISTKFLGANGGYTSDAVKAADYLTDLKRRHGLNIVASNNSWGGGGFSQSLLDAINRGGDAGILFVAAAGNGGSDGIGDNNDSVASYPSNYQCATRFDTKAARGWDCVVAVASITSSGSKSSFSNYGATTVDLGAPGSGIVSTVPLNTYANYSGTSMATPHVTGAIALCEAADPTLTAQQLRANLLASVAPTTSIATTTASGGRLDAGALGALCTPSAGGGTSTPDTQAPTAPGSLTATAQSSSSIALAWQAATDDVGVTGYEIWRTSGGVRVKVATTTGLSYTNTGLSASTAYDYEVIAYDAAGNLGPAATASATTPALTLPGAFDKTSPADGTTGLGTSVGLRWNASAGAASYEVCVDTSNDGLCAGSWTNVGNTTAATARVSRRLTYYWQVRAVNATGTTASSAGTWWRFSTR